ncbi:unnamed protein product [Zymoseptoria tritici ST99CH_3D7]|uniref:Ecp2 effector protein domain-containing protein n=2 Tax=Zymoseptoria tritici TaxID=1047171 RepID=A0A1X7S7G1_ZYMT9|nr:unnamed protein product [Zymoseptoria tritici ST99CH_3D7]SMR60669.1 unnamed protein product [Zymoseptoria tritici ST99CH_1E4]
MKLSTYLTALTLALAGTGTAQEFKVTFRPFKNGGCTDDLTDDKHPVNGPGIELVEGECRSWVKDRAFDSYLFKYAGEKRPMKGRVCDLILFGNEECEKDSALQMVEEIDSLKKDDVCQNEDTGFKGRGMSVQIWCNDHK